jgi:hypothetical protein
MTTTVTATGLTKNYDNDGPSLRINKLKQWQGQFQWPNYIILYQYFNILLSINNANWQYNNASMFEIKEISVKLLFSSSWNEIIYLELLFSSSWNEIIYLELLFSSSWNEIIYLECAIGWADVGTIGQKYPWDLLYNVYRYQKPQFFFVPVTFSSLFTTFWVIHKEGSKSSLYI